MPMSQGQVRVVDPILSTHALGYKQAELIGDRIFPFVPVGAYGGKVLEFGKESFRLYNTARAPGSATKRISFGYEGAPYAITPSALEAVVPREWMRDASQVPGIDLASRAVNTVLRAMRLSHEWHCARLALDPSKYDAAHKNKLAAGKRWANPDSTPTRDIEIGREAVADTIGIEPNTLMLSRKAFSALRYHPKLLEQVAHTKLTSITVDILKALWNIDEIIIGTARAATGKNDQFGDVWGVDALLTYSTVSGTPNAEEPSYGYTYRIEGHPAVEAPYWDNNAKSWVYGVSDDNVPVLSGMMAGYLIQDAGAPAA